MLSFHPPGLHGYKLTEDKQSNVIYLYTYFKHQLKWIKSFLPSHAHAIASTP
jgi:hypothetical protein